MRIHQSHVDGETVIVVGVRGDDLGRAHLPDLIRGEMGELDRRYSLCDSRDHHFKSSSCRRMATPSESSSSSSSLNAYEVCTWSILELFPQTGPLKGPRLSRIAI